MVGGMSPWCRIRAQKAASIPPALNEVAYVRFASVYRQFRDVNEFMAELKQFLGESGKHRA